MKFKCDNPDCNRQYVPGKTPLVPNYANRHFCCWKCRTEYVELVDRVLRKPDQVGNWNE